MTLTRFSPDALPTMREFTMRAVSATFAEQKAAAMHTRLVLSLAPDAFSALYEDLATAETVDDLSSSSRGILRQAISEIGEKEWTSQEEQLHPRGTAGRFRDKPGQAVRDVVDVGQAVQGAVDAARARESDITPVVKEAVKTAGGTLEGKPLKSGAEMTQKLDRMKDQMPGADQAKEASAMSDALRYHAVMPGEGHVSGIHATVAGLAQKGYQLEKMTNYWQDGSPYKGVHAVFHNPETGHRFEMEFHTNESWKRKHQLGLLYDQFRDSKDNGERKRIFDQMVQASSEVKAPPQIEDVGTPHEPGVPTPQEPPATTALHESGDVTPGAPQTPSEPRPTVATPSAPEHTGTSRAPEPGAPGKFTDKLRKLKKGESIRHQGVTVRHTGTHDGERQYETSHRGTTDSNLYGERVTAHSVAAHLQRKFEKEEMDKESASGNPNFTRAQERARQRAMAAAPPEADFSHGFVDAGTDRPAGSPGTSIADPDSKDAIDVGDDVEKAAKLLAEGKAVNLTQPRQVSLLLDKVAQMVDEAKAKGEDAPSFDLCKVTVKGTNLFCVKSKGIPRIKMPQLKGHPVKGSKADQMPRNKKGEVDLTDAFIQHLKDQGINVESGKERAAYLKATQNELNGGKVGGIAGYLEGGGQIEDDLLTTRDGYVIDGHHRWAAVVAQNARDNNLDNDPLMSLQRIDADIIHVLYQANKFAAAMGIPSAGFEPPKPKKKEIPGSEDVAHLERASKDLVAECEDC